jgi:choline dehydrogenase
VPANSVYYLGKDPLWNNPLIDWMQQTTPQAGLENDEVLFSQGHTLGGGSARNFMWYQRGAKTVYNQWAQLTGDSGWSWDNFLPFMKASVQFTKPKTFVQAPPESDARSARSPKYNSNDYSPTGGPLQVSYPPFIAPAGAYIGGGLTELGLKQLPGMVNGNLLGWMNCANTIDPKTQTRSSSETSMLREAIQRNFNLQIYTETLAKKILFDGNRAYGVNVEVQGVGSGNVNFMINATKEVIVSAGAFRSPQLLMVSGVGPAQTLADYDIPVVSALEGVGQSMMDHIWTAITREVDVRTLATLGDPEVAAQANAEYVNKRTGLSELT